ncbi:MAG: hypothetical protein PHQ17_08220 [Methanobacterium sp.]|nr:hypothetical protein [Methanobacterium sp.]
MEAPKGVLFLTNQLEVIEEPNQEPAPGGWGHRGPHPGVRPRALSENLDNRSLY